MPATNTVIIANIVLRMAFASCAWPRRPAIRYATAREKVLCAGSRSLDLEAGAFDHLLPFLGLGDDVLAELLGRLDQRLAAKLDQLGLDPGLGKDLIHRGIELGDNFLRRVLRRAHAEQRARL